MAQVYNWQIGRDMEFPYANGDTTRQFAAVFNINRCIGCQTCTMACKSTWTFSPGQELMWWNNVETKPFGGYPDEALRRLSPPLGRQHARPPRRTRRWQPGLGSRPVRPDECALRPL
jgi:nitrate reductase beta subunit